MKALICRMLKVPSEPEPPPGQPPRIFRAAPNFLRLKQLVWCLGLAFLAMLAIGSAVGAYFALETKNDIPWPVLLMIVAAAALLWIVLILEMVVGLFIVRLDYEMRWYMVSDRALRIREGIWTVKEKTIALANIQNISIHQGPLQRILGIADVEVRTAGGGDERAEKQQGKIGDPLHIGYFRGVDNANEIRDVLQAATRKQTDTGLGDPDEGRVDPLDAALSLLRETTALRELLQR